MQQNSTQIQITFNKILCAQELFHEIE